jgi:hypothetical protein
MVGRVKRELTAHGFRWVAERISFPDEVPEMHLRTIEHKAQAA